MYFLIKYHKNNNYLCYLLSNILTKLFNYISIIRRGRKKIKSHYTVISFQLKFSVVMQVSSRWNKCNLEM